MPVHNVIPAQAGIQGHAHHVSAVIPGLDLETQPDATLTDNLAGWPGLRPAMTDRVIVPPSIRIH